MMSREVTWIKTPLKGNIDVLTGNSFSSKLFNVNEGIPLIRIRDLLTHKPVTYYLGEYEDKYLIEKKDILVGMDGEFNIVRWNGPRGLLNQRVAKITSKNQNKITNKFLYYKLIKELKTLEAITPATTVKHLAKKDIEGLVLDMPPIMEQQKIAAILSSVDEAIGKTEQIIEQTETVKKGLMQQLLTKGIGHTEFKDSPLGKIPISWETKNIGDVANIIRGASPRPKGDPRYYGGNVPRLMVADITRDKKYIYPSIDTLTEEGANKSRPMSAGSLVMVCSGTVGVPGILAVDACIHDGFLGISDISNECNTEYLFYAFTLLKSKLDSAATHGGVFTNLTTQILKDFIITIPSIYEQRKIVEILTIYDEKIESEEKKLNQLFNIKQGLMQQLLTGKVRVPINEDEEVPS